MENQNRQAIFFPVVGEFAGDDPMERQDFICKIADRKIVRFGPLLGKSLKPIHARDNVKEFRSSPGKHRRIQLEGRHIRRVGFLQRAREIGIMQVFKR